MKQLLKNSKLLWKAWDLALEKLKAESGMGPENCARAWLQAFEIALNQHGYEIVPKTKENE